MRWIIIAFLALTTSLQAQGIMPWAFVKAPGAFNPFSIDSLQLCVFADDLIDSVGKSNNDTLFRALNRSVFRVPRHYGHLTELTNSLKPTIRDSSGVRWIQFDGVDDDLISDDIMFEQPNTVFIVFRWFETSLYQPVWDNRANGTPRNLLFRNNSTTFYANFGLTVNTGITIQYGDTLYIAHSVANGASSYVGFNGNGATINGGTDAMWGFKVGRLAQNVFPAKIYVYAVLIYGKELDATETAYILDGLKTKYEVSW